MKQALCAFIAFAGACALTPLAVAQSGAPVAAPAFHPPHGRGMVDPLEMLAHLKTQLNLNTSQQQQFDAAVAGSKAARASIRANLQQLHAALTTQVATGAPDFDALASLADSLQPQNLAARKTARAGWLALYDTFSVEQKGVVASAIQSRWARMAAWRARTQGKSAN